MAAPLDAPLPVVIEPPLGLSDVDPFRAELLLGAFDHVPPSCSRADSRGRPLGCIDGTSWTGSRSSGSTAAASRALALHTKRTERTLRRMMVCRHLQAIKTLAAVLRTRTPRLLSGATALRTRTQRLLPQLTALRTRTPRFLLGAAALRTRTLRLLLLHSTALRTRRSRLLLGAAALRTRTSRLLLWAAALRTRTARLLLQPIFSWPRTRRRLPRAAALRTYRHRGKKRDAGLIKLFLRLLSQNSYGEETNINPNPVKARYIQKLYFLLHRSRTRNGILLRTIPCLSDFFTKPVRQETLSLQSLLRTLDGAPVSGSRRDPKPLVVLLVRHPSPIQDSSGPDSLIVDVREPLSAEPPLGPGAWGIEPVHDVAEILRTVHRPECKASRQELAAPADDRQHPPRSRGVDDVIESRHRVQHGKPDGPRRFGHHAGRRPHVVHRTPCPGVHPPVVDHNASLVLLPVLRRLLGREGRRAPC